jgi:hypothetical protein
VSRLVGLSGAFDRDDLGELGEGVGKGAVTVGGGVLVPKGGDGAGVTGPVH